MQAEGLRYLESEGSGRVNEWKGDDQAVGGAVKAGAVKVRHFLARAAMTVLVVCHQCMKQQLWRHC